MAVIAANSMQNYLKEYQNLNVTEKDFWLTGKLIDDKLKSLVPEDLIIENFMGIFRKLRGRYRMSRAEHFKFKYNPARFAEFYYGSTEYAWLVLLANELYSAAEFKDDLIWVFHKSCIDLIDEIKSLEKGVKDLNEYDIYQFKKEENINDSIIEISHV